MSLCPLVDLGRILTCRSDQWQPLLCVFFERMVPTFFERMVPSDSWTVCIAVLPSQAPRFNEVLVPQHMHAKLKWLDVGGHQPVSSMLQPAQPWRLTGH